MFPGNSELHKVTYKAYQCTRVFVYFTDVNARSSEGNYKKQFVSSATTHECFEFYLHSHPVCRSSFWNETL